VSLDRIHEVFAAALHHRPDTVEDFLARECCDEPDVRDEVSSLLAARREATGFLDRTATDRIEAGAWSEPPPLEPGDVLDGFEILGQLGRGGSSVVYEALASDPRRVVALKVLRLGVLDTAGHARVRAEAAALARLQHPAVAHVYGMGVHAGHPYLVMERVPGARSATRFADENDLSPAARLALWAVLCDGVHHGHQRGVLHNDLKPANLLVGDDGFPKIIDFGIAGIVDHASDETHRRPLGGTLPYMSPEALDTRGDVDVRSDVYALGVIGHELLTGSLPLDPGDRAPADAAKWLRERLASGEVAVAPGLRGDLAAIVRTAMAPELARRYPSASALADDIRRAISHRPVEARQGGLLYSVRCLARRHRVAFAAAVALVIVSITAAAVGTTMALDKERERARAAHERDRASFQSYIANLAAAEAALRAHDAGAAAYRLAAAPEPYRNWEWHHFHSRLDASKRAFRRGDSAEYGAVSPDGTLIAAGRKGYTVWDVPSGETLHVEPYDEQHGSVIAMAFSPDGERLALGFVLGTVRIIDARTGQTHHTWQAHKAKVWALQFHPDKPLLATIAHDKTALLWSTETIEQTRRFTLPAQPYALQFDGPRNRILVGLGDGQVLAHDLATGTRTLAVSVHGNNVESLRLPGDGTLLASASIDGTLVLLHADSLVPVWREPVRTSPLKGATFVPGLDLIATVSFDRTVRAWSLTEGEEQAVWHGHTDFIRGVETLPSGTLVSFSRDRSVRLWDPGARQRVPRLAGHRAAVQRLAFVAGGKQLVSASSDGEVALWDVDTLERRSLVQASVAATRMPFASTDAHLYTVLEDRTIGRWSASNGRLEARTARAHAVKALAAVPGRGTLVVGARGLLELDIETGAERRLSDDPTPVTELILGPDGDTLAVAYTASFELWSVSAGRRLTRVEINASVDGPSFGFRADGRHLAVGAKDGVHIYGLPAGTHLHTLRGSAVAYRAVAYSPDGSRIAAACEDGSVRIYDSTKRQQVAVLKGHPEYAISIAWSPDGTTLASGGGNSGPDACVIRLWQRPR
jgi:WD40 repeat protein